MPKIVDRQARRTQLADAVMRLAARDGLTQLSLRHVAKEAGVSMGFVQHYFASKDELFTFAIGVVSERVEARLAASAGRLGPEPAPRDVAETLLREMLPLDEERWLEGHVGLAYQAYSAVRPDLSAPMREGTGQLLDFLAGGISSTPAAPAGNPRVAAVRLFSLVEGLSMHLLTGHLTARQVETAFRAELDAAFGPAPRRRKR